MRLQPIPTPFCKPSFNPRICKRCDSYSCAGRPRSKVSIHASVKDATLRAIGYNILFSFNPRICKRCDLGLSGNAQTATCFNPRICKRCDSILREATSPSFFVSIHASVKDATGLTTYETVTVNVSIHASVKDATFGLRYWWRISLVSIHASVKDATLSSNVSF